MELTLPQTLPTLPFFKYASIASFAPQPTIRRDSAAIPTKHSLTNHEKRRGEDHKKERITKGGEREREGEREQRVGGVHGAQLPPLRKITVKHREMAVQQR